MNSSKTFAVIFKTKRTLPMPDEYSSLSASLLELAKKQKGFIKIDSVADASGNGVSISYWESLEAIKTWKAESSHLYAQGKGKAEWYLDYSVEICEIVRSYEKSTSVFESVEKNNA
jgi:heme-degrading monooxygenase HmoA